MRRTGSILVALICGASWAQMPAGAPVPVQSEPSHHLVLDTSRARAFKVEVAPHGSTLLHQHDKDYIWIAIGDARIINAVAGKPETRVAVPDGSLRFAHGGFAHVARNESDAAFRNVTIELLSPQTGERNLCGQVLPDASLNCPAGAAAAESGSAGATPEPLFETDQTRIGLLRLAPKGRCTVAASGAPPLLVALQGTVAEATVQTGNAGGVAGRGRRRLREADLLDVPPGLAMELRNAGRAPARFLVIEFKDR